MLLSVHSQLVLKCDLKKTNVNADVIRQTVVNKVGGSMHLERSQLILRRRNVIIGQWPLTATSFLAGLTFTMAHVRSSSLFAPDTLQMTVFPEEKNNK